MEVFYMRPVIDTDPEERLMYEPEKARATQLRMVPVQQIIPMRGGLRGKAKRTVWVDIDSLVMIAGTGLSGTTHEIIAVFSPEQVARYRKIFPQADERLFLKGGADAAVADQDGIIFDATAEEEEVDVDDI
jgi:hypothetical protein